MGMWDRHRRKKLAWYVDLYWRVASEHYSSLSSETRIEMLASEFSHAQLKKLESLVKDNREFRLDFISRAILMHRDNRDQHLSQVEVLLDSFDDFEEWSPEYYAARKAMENILDYIKYEQDIDRHKDTDIPDRPLTDTALRALAKVHTLINALPEDQRPKNFPWSDRARFHFNKKVPTSGGWLTEYTLAHPESPEQVVAEYLKRQKKRDALKTRFAGHRFFTYEDKPVPENLCDYSDEVLNWMDSLADSSDYTMVISFAHAISDGATAAEAYDLYRFMPKYSKDMSWNLPRHIAALRHYPGLLEDYPDLSELPVQVHAQCEALIIVGAAMEHHASKELTVKKTIADQRVADWVIENPEDAEEFAKIVEERETADFELTRNIRSSVLGEGYL